MLQSAWAITGWLVWLEDQANAAIHHFNRTIMHQVAMDARIAKDSRADSKKTSTAGTLPAREGVKQVDLAATISKAQVSDATRWSSESTLDTNERRREQKGLEEVYPDKSGILFSRFIFSFNSLYELLRDMHIFPPAAFEAARILKRLRVPRSPRLANREATTTAEGPSDDHSQR